MTRLYLMIFIFLISCKSNDNYYSYLEEGNKIERKININGLWEGDLNFGKKIDSIFVRLRINDQHKNIDIPSAFIINQKIKDFNYNNRLLSFSFHLRKSEYSFFGNVKENLLKKYIIQGNIKQNDRIRGFLSLKQSNLVQNETKEEKIKKVKNEELFFQFNYQDKEEEKKIEYFKAENEKAIYLFLQDLFVFDKDGNMRESPGKNDFLKSLRDKFNLKGISVIQLEIPFISNPPPIYDYSNMLIDIIEYMKKKRKSEKTKLGILAFGESNLIAVKLLNQYYDKKISLISVNSVLNNFSNEYLNVYPSNKNKMKNAIESFLKDKEVDNEFKIYFSDQKKEYLKSAFLFDIYKEYNKLKNEVFFLYGRKYFKYNKSDYLKIAKIIKKNNNESVLISDANYILKNVNDSNNLKSYFDPKFSFSINATNKIINFILS